MILKGSDTVEVTVSDNSDIIQKFKENNIPSVNSTSSDITLCNQTSIETKNNFLGENINNLYENIINNFIFFFKPLLEPVMVSYPNQQLAEQIYVISIMLLIISLTITFFFLILLFNLLIVNYGEQISNKINYKFITWYIKLQTKFIKIEIFILSMIILYFMSYLIMGLHFIATHPIIFK